MPPWIELEPLLRCHFATKVGLELGPVLGVGHLGIVFQTLPGRVVKLTDQVREATFYRWLAGVDAHPAMPVVHRSGHIDLIAGSLLPAAPEDGHFYLYAIEREDVPDLILPEVAGIEPQELSYAFHFALEDLPGARASAWRRPDPELMDQTRRASTALLQQLAPQVHDLFMHIVDGVLWLLENGCRTGGLHEGNIGLRQGQAVIRDHSMTTPPIGYEQQAFELPFVE